MKIDPDNFKAGVFVWEDLDDELNVGLSENIEDDPIYALMLLTEALSAVTIQIEAKLNTAH